LAKNPIVRSFSPEHAFVIASVSRQFASEMPMISRRDNHHFARLHLANLMKVKA